MAPIIAAAVISGAVSVVGGIVNWLKSKNEANKQKAYNNMVAKLHNEWLATRDDKVKEILDELKSRGQDIFGPQKTTQESTQSSSTTTNEYEAPEITAEYKPMAEMQRALVEKQLGSMPTGEGLKETNAEAQNQAYAGAINNTQNLARERGQSMDAAMIGNPADMARRGAIAQYNAQVPFLLSDEARKRADLATSVMTAFGRATRRKGTSNTTGYSTTTQTGPADYSAIAGLLLPPGPKAATQA